MNVGDGVKHMLCITCVGGGTLPSVGPTAQCRWGRGNHGEIDIVICFHKLLVR